MPYKDIEKGRENHRKRLKRWALRHPERAARHRRAVSLRLNFNLTIAEYDALLAKQHGCCAICMTTVNEANRRLAVDHCHFTSKVRGLLCGKCNRGLGNFNHNPELLEKAIGYLRNPPNEQ